MLLSSLFLKYNASSFNFETVTSSKNSIKHFSRFVQQVHSSSVKSETTIKLFVALSPKHVSVFNEKRHFDGVIPMLQPTPYKKLICRQAGLTVLMHTLSADQLWLISCVLCSDLVPSFFCSRFFFCFALGFSLTLLTRLCTICEVLTSQVYTEYRAINFD